MDCTLRIFTLPLAAAAMVSVFAGSQVAAHKPAAARSELRAVTSADAVLQVSYPKYLVRCQHLDAENPDVWEPENACAASIPVCDSSGHSGNVLVCLGYPVSDFQGSELQAAALSVNRLDNLGTASECRQRWARPNTTDVHSESIHGLKFEVAKAVETEASHVADHYMYRTFHKAACYELDVNISIALDSAFAAEDAPRKLTEPEREKIKAGLMEALRGFRFLK
jgi:hypothetical protein